MGSLTSLLCSSLSDTWSKNVGTSWGSVWSSNLTLRQSLEIGNWTAWRWRVIHAYRLRLIWSLIFEFPFRFIFLVYWLVHTFMALHFYSAATIRRFAVFCLTFNMFVNKISDFLAIVFLIGVYVRGTLVLLSVTTCGFNTIAAYMISLRFCCSSHLPECWYMFFMLFILLCLKEDQVHNDCPIPIVFIWSSRRDDCNIHLITTQCCSNVSIDRIELLALFSIHDLTHWAAWGDLLFIWKHKYSLPAGGVFLFYLTQQVQ